MIKSKSGCPVNRIDLFGGMSAVSWQRGTPRLRKFHRRLTGRGFQSRRAARGRGNNNDEASSGRFLFRVLRIERPRSRIEFPILEDGDNFLRIDHRKLKSADTIFLLERAGKRNGNSVPVLECVGQENEESGKLFTFPHLRNECCIKKRA